MMLWLLAYVSALGFYSAYPRLWLLSLLSGSLRDYVI